MVRNSDWHELEISDSDVDSVLPKSFTKKTKFYADANIPRMIIDELRSVGITVDSITEEGSGSLPDTSVYQLVKKKKQVLLTMDRDFWDENKFPLQKSPGIVFVDVPPDKVGQAIDGLAVFYGIVGQYLPLDWWHQMRVRVTSENFEIKMITYEGKIEEDVYKILNDGKILTKKIR